eukprot:CAMPEP_0173373686 /NCGR_PEP_ID=MMETSP1144-20121109/28644_1 /TAXON_ID=483371 /ORGANISM="non described non described, Strain CCMP2298" /LENGTH=118 /DNA_ID=CAMNT_0014325905 /DNA_START=357 /DNA_END=713 /DNA_ORIENTATION=+
MCLNEVEGALAEWRRVLAVGGRLLIGVPDLLTLSAHFSAPTTSDVDRDIVKNIMYGGQVSPHDVHKTGFYWSYLRRLLQKNGFCEVRKVFDFGIFRDSTQAMFSFGEPLSLNVASVKC